MIPACFSNPTANTHRPSSSGTTTTTATTTQMPQSLITCIYQIHLCNSPSPTHLTLTWSKSLFSHSLTLHSPHFCPITISLHPSTFSFFKTRTGSKSIYSTHHHQKIKLHWDFTRAEFTHNSAEPDSSFYIAITCNSRLEFFLGDRREDLSRRSGLAGAGAPFSDEPTLMSRREHVFGHRNYVTRAEFSGAKHEIGIECGGGVLRVRVDGATRLVVKRLAWKFRGNERIEVGGVEVEFYWDVLNWVNSNRSCGVFMFQIGEGGVWPEMAGPEKRLMRKTLLSAAGGSVSLSPAPSCSSVLQWAEENSDCGRSSCSSSTRSCGSAGGFSLLLYAWRKD